MALSSAGVRILPGGKSQITYYRCVTPVIAAAKRRCGDEAEWSLRASLLPAVERYSPQENRWHTTAPMGTRRKHLGCAVYQDMIYAVGGRDDTTELSSAERFNPRANQWSPVVAMTSRRSGVSARYGDRGGDEAPWARRALFRPNRPCHSRTGGKSLLSHVNVADRLSN